MADAGRWQRSLGVETLAGAHGDSGHVDGPLAVARFYWPGSLAIDHRSGDLAIADFYNKKIRYVDVTSGEVRTIADLTSEGVCIHPASHEVLAADWDRHSVVAVDPVSRVVRPIAGCGQRGHQDGAVAVARFNYPGGLCVDVDPDRVLVADQDNHCIRVVDTRRGEVLTLAGTRQPGHVDGPLAGAQFHWPWGMCVEPTTGNILVADSWNHCIRRIDVRRDQVTTLAGDGHSGHRDGVGRDARFEQPTDVGLLDDRHVVVADYCNHCLRVIELATGRVTTLAGQPHRQGHADGAALGEARFDYPGSAAHDPTTDTIVVADYAGHTLRRIGPVTGGPIAGLWRRGRRDVSRAVGHHRWLAFTAGVATGIVASRLL